jgi:hypothetical protein
LAIATPVYAGKADRARQAIAAAEAKIHTAESIGTSTEVPRVTAEARAALASAHEDLAAGDKSASISEAIWAQALADTAIGELQRRKDESAVAAQDAAQRQAADANARAEAAQQAAATSAADAAAARNAAAAAAQTPQTQVDTTVTTQQRGAHRSTRTVTRRATTPAPASSSEVTTSTSVSH